MQEELKRQYKDILEENMRNADLRSQMVREQQTADIQLQEAVEELKEADAQVSPLERRESDSVMNEA